MFEKFKTNALTSNELKDVKGGLETWECTCANGSIGFNGWGDAGDFRDSVINAGCSNSPTYCVFHQL